MTRVFAVLFATAVLSPILPTTPAVAPIKAVRFKRVVVGDGKVVENAVVIVENDRIKSVGAGDTAIPAGAEVLDLARYTAIPGLIDAHTHMTYYWDQKPGTRPWAQLSDRMPAMTMYLAQENARKTLETGVTTARDLGSFEYLDIAMRDLINTGAMPGPRMFVSGYGLQKARTGSRPGLVFSSGRQASGPLAVARVAMQQIEAGADWIKMYGSTGSGDDVTGHQTFTFEEMKAAVDAAHQMGKRIAIHSYGPAGARDAVRAGTDTLEHATDLDDETITEMVRRKTFYVPTIDHNRYYVEYSQQFGYSAEAVKNLNDFIERNLETARRANKAGVRFAMGSDAVFTMFGQNTRELGWFVKAGMTPAEALVTATTNGSAMLGMEKSLGAIAPGYFADIVAYEIESIVYFGDQYRLARNLLGRAGWINKFRVALIEHDLELYLSHHDE